MLQKIKEILILSPGLALLSTLIGSNFISLSTQQKMGTFFELGKDKTANREEWAPPFFSCAQDTVGLKPALPLRLLSYGKPLPFSPLSRTNFHAPQSVRAIEVRLYITHN